MSMMTSNMLCAVEQRLRQSTLTTCTFSFQNKLVILVGDLAQLPTICTHTPKAPDIICRACHITSTPCWAIAKQHTLQTSVRHSSDPLYLEFLNIIQHRPPTESEIEHTLNACFINNDMLSHYLDATTTILCSHREDVIMYNDIIFKSIFASAERIQVTLDTNATEAHNVSAWLNDTRFDQLHHVAVGALVMFTTNVNIAKGVVNGATATVTSVHTDNHGVVTTIGVQVIGNSTNILLKRHNFKHKYTYEQHYYKASFPIVLAYAMTGHKSQGATISNKVIIDIRNAFVPGLTYVMLSRTTNRQNLKIARKLQPSDFIPCPLLDTT
jgi:ATP-dependent exoDNAse (exonuclease V) alpha subunit